MNIIMYKNALLGKVELQTQLFLFNTNTLLINDNIDINVKNIIIEFAKTKDIAIVGNIKYNELKNIFDQDVLQHIKFIFANDCIMTCNIKTPWSENYIQKTINFLLQLTINLNLPYKRGSFIKYNSECINYSPIGFDCNIEEQKLFTSYDEEKGIRKDIINMILNQFENIRVQMDNSIGIQLEPIINNNYVMEYLQKYTNIHYFNNSTKVDFASNDEINLIFYNNFTSDKIMEKLL